MAKETYVNGEKITGGGYRNYLILDDEFEEGDYIEESGFREIIPWIEESDTDSIIYKIKRYISNAVRYDNYGPLYYINYAQDQHSVLGFSVAHFSKQDVSNIRYNRFDKVTEAVIFAFGVAVDNSTYSYITIEICYFPNSKKWGIKITEI